MGAVRAYILTQTISICYRRFIAVTAVAGLVVAWSAALAGTIDLNAEAPDHTLVGAGGEDFTGQTVLFGDINGDGRDDMIVGSRGFDHDGRTGCGVVYVLLASDTLGPVVDFASIRPDLKRIFGPATNSQVGTVVGCGDVNDDGWDDILCGIPTASPRGLTSAGEIYVILGSENPPDTVDLLFPPTGVTRIEGANVFDKLGETVALADVDNDNYGDIIAGAPFSTTPAGSIAGKVFIIYGAATLGPVINLASPSTHITQIFGAHPNGILGKTCYAADVTGDGIADIVAGAPQESPLGRSFAGVAYIIPGSASLPDTIDLAAGPVLGITKIYGPETGVLAGSNFNSGDTNGDGQTDLIVAAPEAAPGGRSGAGSVYVLYGAAPGPKTAPARKTAWPDVIDLASPPGTSTRIDGPAANMKIGSSLTVSDFNLDGYDDVVLGIPMASPPGVPNPRKEAGITHIVFGRQVFPGTVDLAEAQTGTTVIYGVDPYDHLGYSVAAGRMDVDGYDDLFLGANNATVDGQFSAGEAVVLLGSPDITPTAVLFFDAATVDGSVTLEWALRDDLDPGSLLVTRTPGDGVGWSYPEISRLSAGHYMLLDTDVDGGLTYSYQAAVRGEDPQILFQISVTVPRIDGTRLYPNSPNPFRRSTALPFEIPAGGRVQIRVYDVTGSLVAVLADEVFPAGVSEIVWDGRDRSGSVAVSGVYFVRLDYAKQSRVRKMLIIR